MTALGKGHQGLTECTVVGDDVGGKLGRCESDGCFWGSVRCTLLLLGRGAPKLVRSYLKSISQMWIELISRKGNTGIYPTVVLPTPLKVIVEACSSAVRCCCCLRVCTAMITTVAVMRMVCCMTRYVWWRGGGGSKLKGCGSSRISSSIDCRCCCGCSRYSIQGKGCPWGVPLGYGGTRGRPPSWCPALIRCSMLLALPFGSNWGGHTTAPFSHLSI